MQGADFSPKNRRQHVFIEGARFAQDKTDATS